MNKVIKEALDLVLVNCTRANYRTVKVPECVQDVVARTFDRIDTAAADIRARGEEIWEHELTDALNEGLDWALEERVIYYYEQDQALLWAADIQDCAIYALLDEVKEAYCCENAQQSFWAALYSTIEQCIYGVVCFETLAQRLNES